MTNTSYNVFGTEVSTLSALELAERIECWSAAPEGKARVVCFSDTHGIVKGHDDPLMRHALTSADHVAADGHPIAWIGRTLHRLPAQTNNGPDFLRLLTSRSPQSGLRHYLFGGKPGVAEELSRTLQAQFPGIVIAGMDTPPMGASSPAELAKQLQRIKEARPDVVWVCLGAPKQEIWMVEHRHRLPGMTLCGVGAAFDFHTGHVQRAPAWMSRHGVEWAYRYYREPKRLGRRYRQTITRFLLLFAAQAWRMAWTQSHDPRRDRAAGRAGLVP